MTVFQGEYGGAIKVGVLVAGFLVAKLAERTLNGNLDDEGRKRKTSNAIWFAYTMTALGIIWTE